MSPSECNEDEPGRPPRAGASSSSSDEYYDDRTEHVGTVAAPDADADAAARAGAWTRGASTRVDLDDYDEDYDAPRPSSNHLLDRDEKKKVWGTPEVPPDDDDDAPRPRGDDDDDVGRMDGIIKKKEEGEDGRGALELRDDDEDGPPRHYHGHDHGGSIARKAKAAAVAAPSRRAGGGGRGASTRGASRRSLRRGGGNQGQGPAAATGSRRSRRRSTRSGGDDPPADRSSAPLPAPSQSLLEEGHGGGGEGGASPRPQPEDDPDSDPELSVYLAEAYVVEEAEDDGGRLPPPVHPPNDAPPPPARGRWWENKCLVGAIAAVVLIVIGAAATVAVVVVPAIMGEKDAPAAKVEGGAPEVLVDRVQGGAEPAPSVPPTVLEPANDPGKQLFRPVLSKEPTPAMAIAPASSGDAAGITTAEAFDVQAGTPTAVPASSGAVTTVTTAEAFEAQTGTPTAVPASSGLATAITTVAPTANPTSLPTAVPSGPPSLHPSTKPTKIPTAGPMAKVTMRPTLRLSEPPMDPPTKFPTVKPTPFPTSQTLKPTAIPTKLPTNYPTVPPSKSPLVKPTKLPTRRPTPQPALQPTKLPTSLPTDSPTKIPTKKPTLQPTLQVSAPANKPTSNDRCEESWAADVGLPASFSGTTVGTTSDFLFPTCGVGKESRGVWYTLEGQGKIVRIVYALDVRGNGLNPQIAIFTGTCAFLNCVKSIEGNGYYGTPATHEFHALEGMTYRILLTGKTEATIGGYTFDVSDYSLPENDECEDGIAIPFTPVARPGTTEGATSDVDPSVGEHCGVSSSSRGVWYTLEGKGKIVRLEYAMTIRGNGLNPELSIFKGPCSFLQCVENIEGNGYYGSPAIKEFHAEEGTLYRFLLSGKTFATASAYQFKVTEYDLPNNDKCQDSTAISSLPISYTGTTVGATSDFGGINDVCGISLESRGVWYTLVGKGKIVRLEYSMIISGNNLNPELSVFTGSCGNLSCVKNTEGNGYYNTPAIYEFHALDAVTYHILLSGKKFEVASGYQFEVSEYEHPPNDQCEDATPIASLPLSTYGTTAGATSDFGGISDLCGISVDSRGVWYTLVGDGKITRLEYSMQITGGRLDRELSVFTGSCSNLSCVKNTEGSGQYNTAAIYEFHALQDVTYYFLLSGKSFVVASGYQFEVSAYDHPLNDICDDATSITSLPLSTTGTTEGATSDFEGDVCGISADSRGVWYTLVGTGTNIRLEYNMQITGSRLDRELSVFTGACDNLICIENTEGSGQYNTAAAQEFRAEEGVTYYILLSGKTFGVASGYQFEVSEAS